MMRLSYQLVLTAISCSLMGCINDDVPTALKQQIRLGGSTRGDNRDGGVDEGLFAAGERVYVWADRQGTSDGFIKAWPLTADGYGGFDEAKGNQRFWPINGSSLYFRALHGNFTFTGDMTLPATVTHTVAGDQTTDAAYNLSDLLYAETVAAVSDGIVELPFVHLLSKLIIHLLPGYDEVTGWGVTAAELVGATLTLRNIRPTATLTMADRSATISGEPISIPTDGEAIIPPQTIGAAAGIPPTDGQCLLTVSLTDGRVFDYVPQPPVSFESGKVYYMDISVRNLIQVTPYVYDWNGTDSHSVEWNWRVYSPSVSEWDNGSCDVQY